MAAEFVRRDVALRGRVGDPALLLDQRLDEDVASGSVAQGDSGAAHLAQNCGGAGNFRDAGRFTESHFADALAKMNVSGQRTHPTRRSSGELTEWHGFG